MDPMGMDSYIHWAIHFYTKDTQPQQDLIAGFIDTHCNIFASKSSGCQFVQISLQNAWVGIPYRPL